MTSFSRLLIAVCLIVGAVGPAHAQAVDPAAVMKRLDALEASQKAIQKQLEEIKTLLQQAPRPVPPPGPVDNVHGLEINLMNAAVKGPANAKYALVEFSDFQCPFCGRYSRDAYGPLTREFVDTGKIRYAFRHLPLESIHPFALKAAEAAECAREQGKFWELHDELFANQQALGQPELLKYAQNVGVDAGKFQSCLDSGKTAARIREDQVEATRLGANSTPSFFIGQIQPDGKVKVLRKISGAQPYATFRAALQGLLATPPAPAK